MWIYLYSAAQKSQSTEIRKLPLPKEAEALLAENGEMA